MNYIRILLIKYNYNKSVFVNFDNTDNLIL